MNAHEKKVISICTFLLAVQLATAQQLDSATQASRQKQYDYYWQKHKRRAKTGWILLGTGLAAMGGGLYLLGQGLSDYPSVDLPVPLTIGMAVYGVGATLTSATFFIFAGDNKRKARLALKGETFALGKPLFYKPTYPALSLAIPF